MERCFPNRCSQRAPWHSLQHFPIKVRFLLIHTVLISFKFFHRYSYSICLLNVFPSCGEESGHLCLDWWSQIRGRRWTDGWKFLCFTNVYIFLNLPDDVEDGRYEELIVDSHSNISWLVESWGYGADSVAQVNTPQQEQELSWNKDRQHKTYLITQLNP